MNNKDFIPYQESLELKKLGFDEPCFFAFDNCSTPMRCSDLRTNEQKFNGVNYNSSTYTSQPTFSQAFRWFREKHNLQSHIFLTYEGVTTNEHNEYAFATLKAGGYDYMIDDDNYPYEEAELACLRKLIQIVKQGGKQ